MVSENLKKIALAAAKVAAKNTYAAILKSAQTVGYGWNSGQVYLELTAKNNTSARNQTVASNLPDGFTGQVQIFIVTDLKKTAKIDSNVKSIIMPLSKQFQTAINKCIADHPDYAAPASADKWLWGTLTFKD